MLASYKSNHCTSTFICICRVSYIENMIFKGFKLYDGKQTDFMTYVNFYV